MKNELWQWTIITMMTMNNDKNDNDLHNNHIVLKWVYIHQILLQSIVNNGYSDYKFYNSVVFCYKVMHFEKLWLSFQVVWFSDVKMPLLPFCGLEGFRSSSESSKWVEHCYSWILQPTEGLKTSGQEWTLMLHSDLFSSSNYCMKIGFN